MRYRKLGNTNLKASILGFGCWQLGKGLYWNSEHQGQDEVNALVGKALDLGINYFDTAEMYNNGNSEQSLGIALQGRRDDAIIGTKISPSSCQPGEIEKHLDASLKRLGTGHVDIYMLHWPLNPRSVEHFTSDRDAIANPPSVESTFGELMRLQDEGKILHLGVSNHGTTQMDRVLETGASLVVNEVPYNLISRAIEVEILPYCEKKGMGVFGYMALQQGILSGMYARANDIPPPQAHSRHFKQERGGKYSRHGEEGCEAEMFQVLDHMAVLAREHGFSLAELSISWCLANQAITSTLVGTSKVEKLEANAKITDYRIPRKLRDDLDKITRPVLEKLGSSPDYYEPRGQGRIY